MMYNLITLNSVKAERKSLKIKRVTQVYSFATPQPDRIHILFIKAKKTALLKRREIG